MKSRCNNRINRLLLGCKKPKLLTAPKALGQDMAQQPQELRAGNGAGFEPPGLAVAVAEGHLAVFAGENVLFLEYAAIEITADLPAGRQG